MNYLGKLWRQLLGNNPIWLLIRIDPVRDINVKVALKRARKTDL